MVPEEYDETTECKGLQKEKRQKLEEILNHTVTLDTEINDFLIIAGWRPYWQPKIIENADRITRQAVSEYIEKRREGLSRSEKILEFRFLSTTAWRDNIRTIGDLKTEIANKGLWYRNLGYASIARFSNALKDYGIAPIKIGGKDANRGRAKRKYGLELVHDI